MRLFLAITISSLALSSVGCAPIITERPKTGRSTIAQPKNEEEARKILNEAGKDVVYGDTLGEIGAAILIPPYGAYKLGQAAAGALGYELDLTKALPESERKSVNDAGTAVVSIPGKAAAWAAHEEYRGKGKVLGAK